MDCIQSLQRAIEFMETHILENISYEDAARQVYMSSYHFHRLFSMITGMTANEYIRCRKLSMAGQELVMSGRKVLDIALKYGYESPESFARAFSRFHGVTPGAAKRSGTGLRLFNRLILQIKVEGGIVMDYKIVERPQFKVLAKVRAFRNHCVREENNTEIPDFWDQCIESGVIAELNRLAAKPGLYGVCAPISKESTHFDYGIGVIYEDGPVPEGFRVIEMTPTLWAAFPCMGDGAACVSETWDRIFKEFLPGSEYNMRDDVDFELYSDALPPGCFCEVWIPVEKK